MSFHPIVVGSATYNQAGQGRYFAAGSAFGGAEDLWKVAPGRKTQNKTVNASISRTKQFIIPAVGDTPAGISRCTITVQIQAEPGVTSDHIDSLLADISSFAEPATLDRLMLGES